MRNTVACTNCRIAKRQCLLVENQKACQRCTAFGKTCTQPEPGTSSYHRQTKSARRAALQAGHFKASAAALKGWPDLSAENVSPTAADSNHLVDYFEPVIDRTLLGQQCGDPEVDLYMVDPYKLFRDRLEDKYASFTFKLNFCHNPLLRQQIATGRLDEWLIWAILAVLQRHATIHSITFRSVAEASDAYANHAWRLMESNKDNNCFSKVQALLMLVEQSWESGEFSRAGARLDAAIYMAKKQDIQAPPNISRRPLARNEFREAEEKRRALWRCFFLDSLMSTGSERTRLLQAGDLKDINLPCDDTIFIFGGPNERIDLRFEQTTLSLSPTENDNIESFTLRLVDAWAGIVRWMRDNESARTFFVYPPNAWHDVQALQAKLPHHLGYSLFFLQSHWAEGSGQAYVGMWALFHLARMATFRTCLPFWDVRTADDITGGDLSHWTQYCKRRLSLLEAAATVCDMAQEIASFGRAFARGLPPWIGSTIYLAVGVQLWLFHYSLDSDSKETLIKAEQRVMDGYKFFGDLQASPIALKRCLMLRKLHAYYCIKTSRSAREARLLEQNPLKRPADDNGAPSSPSLVVPPPSIKRLKSDDTTQLPLHTRSLPDQDATENGDAPSSSMDAQSPSSQDISPNDDRTSLPSPSSTMATNTGSEPKVQPRRRPRVVSNTIDLRQDPTVNMSDDELSQLEDIGYTFWKRFLGDLDI